MADENIVEPKPGIEATSTPAADSGAELPDELLKLPAMQGVLSGSPGAFSAVLAQFDKDPAAKLISKNKDALMNAGVNFYRSLDGQQGVVFNSLHVSGDDIKSADAAGQLQSIAPPFDQVNSEIGKSGAANPVLNAQVPEGMAMGGGAPMAAPPPMAASAQRSVATKRANNLQLGSPTSGAAPGAGRLLNTILKPTI